MTAYWTWAGKLPYKTVKDNQGSAQQLSYIFLHMKGRTALQPVSAALEMNPKERALYLKQKHTGVTLTDDEATVASATAAGLRSFLRQASSFCLRARLSATCPPLHVLTLAASFLHCHA